MNEPKRRGRPPKVIAVEVSREGAQQVEWSAASEPRAITHIEPADDAPLRLEFARRQAQAYARRIWEGQSPDLSHHERLGRIAEALKAQGLSMEGVELP